MAELTITTCNARWGHDRHDEPFDLDAVVARFDTDVIAIQELWDPHDAPGERQAHARSLGYEVLEVPQSPSLVVPTPQITPDPSHAAGTWGIALLSRLPIRRWRRIDLGRLVERWDVAHRQAILAEVEVDGTALTIAAVHLSFVPLNAAAQLRRLSGALPRDRPSVVAGDCNLWGPPTAALVARHRRAVRGRTWPAHRPHSQLDHLLISPEITVAAGGVLEPTGSDHLPLQARLRLG